MIDKITYVVLGITAAYIFMFILVPMVSYLV